MRVSAFGNVIEHVVCGRRRLGGAEMASDDLDVSSLETNIGYGRGVNFASSGGEVHNRAHLYRVQSIWY